MTDTKDEGPDAPVKSRRVAWGAACGEIADLFAHPGYPLRAAWSGSKVLLRLLGRPARAIMAWAVAGREVEGEGAWFRLALVTVPSGFLLWELRHYAEIVVIGGGAVWIVAAWAVSPTTPPEDDQEEVGEQHDEPEAEDEPDDTQDAGESMTLAILQAVSIHTSGGTKGVHLDVLASHLRLSIRAVREHCQRAGIPVRPQLKVRGRNVMGIHRGDLEDTLGAPLPHIIQTITNAPVTRQTALGEDDAATIPAPPHLTATPASHSPDNAA
ncbi:hypothetical protein ACWGCW_31560 [Streptomyces sp. NPDC054933]